MTVRSLWRNFRGEKSFVENKHFFPVGKVTKLMKLVWSCKPINDKLSTTSCMFPSLLKTSQLDWFNSPMQSPSFFPFLYHWITSHWSLHLQLELEKSTTDGSQWKIALDDGGPGDHKLPPRVPNSKVEKKIKQTSLER